jgi:hypothetical protein
MTNAAADTKYLFRIYAGIFMDFNLDNIVMERYRIHAISNRIFALGPFPFPPAAAGLFLLFKTPSYKKNRVLT